MQFPISDQ